MGFRQAMRRNRSTFVVDREDLESATRRWIVLLALPLLVAAFGFAFGLRNVSLAAGPPSRQLDFLLELQERAVAGEAWAQDAVASIENLAAAKHVSAQELALAGGAFTERTGKPMAIGAQGIRPFFVRLDASVKLTTAGDLDRYLKDRQAALAALVRTGEGAPITASLGFAERPTIGDVLNLVRAHNAVIEQVLLDATLNGKRLFTQVMALDEAAAMTEITNDDVSRRLTLLANEMEQPLCGAEASDIEWRVRAMRVSLSAADAAALATEPAVLLVDPLDDVTAAYRGQAAEVNVGAWPNVTITSEQLAGKAVADAICQEGR